MKKSRYCSLVYARKHKHTPEYRNHLVIIWNEYTHPSNYFILDANKALDGQMGILQLYDEICVTKNRYCDKNTSSVTYIQCIRKREQDQD